MSRWLTVVFVTVASSAAQAHFIAFEGSQMPEDAGWDRVGTFDADRWIDDGWFVHSMDLGDHGPPPDGEFDFYRQGLADWAGAEQFFVEFRMESDGPASEIPGIAPGGVSIPGGGAWYAVTVARDRIRFMADFSIPLVDIDIEPDVPHTYRLEVTGGEWYRFLIDGAVVTEGVPAGPTPDDQTLISWGGRYYLHHNTNRWDYILFGTIPEPASGLLSLLGGVALAGRRPPRSCVSCED